MKLIVHIKLFDWRVHTILHHIFFYKKKRLDSHILLIYIIIDHSISLYSSDFTVDPHLSPPPIFLSFLSWLNNVHGKEKTEQRGGKNEEICFDNGISDANEVTSLPEFLCVFPRWPEQIFWLAFKPVPDENRCTTKSSTVG